MYRVALTGGYEHGPSHKIHNNALSMLKTYTFTNLKMWEPFRTNIPNLRGIVRLHQKHKLLDEIPIEQFFEGMNHLGLVRLFGGPTFSLMGLLFDFSRNCDFSFYEHSDLS